ncbi:hypothetical protein [Laceyella putida]|uniref:Uncharacterized protein n=1 Tax=Laceyella putida TaxID=110101 RepID=A0ABW2RRA0_9BACL
MKDKTRLPTPEFDTDELSPEEYSYQIKRKTIALIGAGIACSVFSYALLPQVGSVSPEGRTPITAQQSNGPHTEKPKEFSHTPNPTESANEAGVSSDKGPQPAESASHSPDPADPDSSSTPGQKHASQGSDAPAKSRDRNPLDIHQAPSDAVAKATPAFEKNPSSSSDIHRESSTKTPDEQTDKSTQKTPKDSSPCTPSKNKLAELLRDLIN